MKFKHLFLALIMASVSCSNVEEEPNDLKKLELEGKVKSIALVSIHNSSNVKKLPSYTLFDIKGNLTLQVSYDGVGRLDKKSQYKYDSKDNIIEEFKEFWIGGPTGDGYHGRSDKSVYKYDENSENVLEVKKYKESKLIRTQINVYDDNGNKIEENNFNSSGEEWGSWTANYDESGNKIEVIFLDKKKEIYKYDKSGNMVESTNYGDDGSISGRHTSEFDNNGYKIAENYFTSSGKISSSQTAKYDNNGNKIEENNFNSSGEKWGSWTAKYDDNGNKIEFIDINGKENSVYDIKNNIIHFVKYRLDGSVSFEETYTYNDNNKIIEKIKQNNGKYDNSKVVNKYEYDNKNWISLTQEWNGEPNFIIQRRIDYYEDDEASINTDTYLVSLEKSANKFILESLLKFKDVELTLLDGGINKSEAMLGSPDSQGMLYDTKKAWVYFNKVNDNGTMKHLVLFFRWNFRQRKYVEEIYAVGDGERASYGIHYVMVNGNKVSSNSPTYKY